MWLSYIVLHWTFKLDSPHTHHSSYLVAVEKNSNPAPYPSSCVWLLAFLAFLGILLCFLYLAQGQPFPGSLVASSLQLLNMFQVSSTKNKTCWIRYSFCAPLQTFVLRLTEHLHLTATGSVRNLFDGILCSVRVRLSILLTVISLSVK